MYFYVDESRNGTLGSVRRDATEEDVASLANCYRGTIYFEADLVPPRTDLKHLSKDYVKVSQEFDSTPEEIEEARAAADRADWANYGL